MFVLANNNTAATTNYDYYTLLIVSVIIYLCCLEYFNNQYRKLEKHIHELELTIKLNTTNIYEKTKLIEARIETINEANDIADNEHNKLTNEVNKLTSEVNKLTSEVNKLTMISYTQKELLSTLCKEQHELYKNKYTEEFIMAGTYNGVPILLYKGIDNILKAISVNYSTHAHNTLFESDNINILLSSLIKFKNVKQIELTKLHRYTNIIDDMGTIIWNKEEDNLRQGYNIVITFLDEHKFKYN
jgi:hypothetical protein